MFRSIGKLKFANFKIFFCRNHSYSYGSNRISLRRTADASVPSKQDGVSVLNGLAFQRFLRRESRVAYSLWIVCDAFLRLGHSSFCSLPQDDKADFKAQKEFENLQGKLDAAQFLYY